MNTDQLTAPGAAPPFLFVSNETSYAVLFYFFEIIDHTHAILSPIALIQLLQPRAGKAVTTEAIFDAIVRYPLTVLDSTGYTAFQFETVVTSAAWACVFISCICSAEAAVHSAGSDQRRGKCMCHFTSNLRHVTVTVKTCMVGILFMIV